MTTVEVLKAARARIEKGWGQGIEGSGLKPNCQTECAGVAIDRAYRATDLNRTTPYYAASEFFSAAIGGGAIVPWNDAPGRTRKEVLAAFDKAISLAEKEIP